MSDIKKKARDLLELLLSHYLAAGFTAGDPLAASAANAVAIKAIAAAFTPPEGFVLVPVEPTAEMRRAGIPHVSNPYGLAGDVYRAMLAARPEVSP